MLKIVNDNLSEEEYNTLYKTYYDFFLHMEGLLADLLFKKSTKNPIRKSAINAINSLEQDNVSFYLYYLNNTLVSFGRLYHHDNILHLGEMLFPSFEDAPFIINSLLDELQTYAQANNYTTLEIEISKGNIDAINLVLDNGFKFIDENPQTAAMFKTYILYKDIYERTNNNQQRKRQN